MTSLHRHQLVWLNDAGWRQVRACAPDQLPWDTQAVDALRHWANADLPLVVTRQPVCFRPVGSAGRPTERITLGLPAPLRWNRRRLFVEADATTVCKRGEFACASEVIALLPVEAQACWPSLCGDLDGLHVTARVYGSYGWQVLTGLPYLHERSDLDLFVELESSRQADAVAAVFERVGFEVPRLDGEIVFSEGTAVAWREWAAWRSGRVDQILVKRLLGAALEDARSWAVTG
jgi:phosphoribosyl-dephospho-CoA transferase